MTNPIAADIMRSSGYISNACSKYALNINHFRAIHVE